MVFKNLTALSESEVSVLLDFSKFSKKECLKFIFEEILQLVNVDGNVIDEVTISVERSVQDKDSFDVFQYSQDEKLMLRTRSHVTTSLGTESEVRKMSQNETSKLLRITSMADFYRVFMVETDVEQWTGSRANTELPKAECEPLILEGANVLLLRKLAIGQLLGEFVASTVNNDGELCEAHYKVEDLGSDEVQVTRIVGSETMTTVLTSAGRIKHHHWSTSQWRLESQHVSRVVSEAQEMEEARKQQEEEEEAEPESKVDLEAYWQRKKEVLALLEDYTVEHSDVQDLMADLMKHILFEKPDDPIDFADKFLSEHLGISRNIEEPEEGSHNSGSICNQKQIFDE